jgi:DNA end-binding protein Ku
VCSQVIDYSDIEKAFEEDGRTVILTKDELKAIPAENSHEIEVVQFVPSEQLEPMMFEKSYYLEPDSKSPKAYVLLRRALEDTDRVAIVQFALREKTRLGALRIKDDVLVLQSLLWPDEVREASFPALDADIRISAQEREMSAALVESMAADFDPDTFTDDYQVQLRTLIDAKLEQGESLDTDETFGAEAGEGGKGEVIDLMEALKRSLDKKRSGGSGAATPSEDAEEDAGAGEETAKPARRARSSAGKSSTASGGSKSAGSGTSSRSTGATTTASKATASKPEASKATASKTTASKTTASRTSAAKAAGTKSPAGKTAAGKDSAKPAAKSTTTRARKPA